MSHADRPAAASGEGVEQAGGGQDVTMESFEQELSKTSPGTYIVYKRLAAPSKSEVFAAYKGGAPFDEIRAMVTERFGRSR